MTLRQLYEAHKGKVSDKWSLYLDEYERLLYPYKDKEVNVLEIGIQNGGSLEIWADYFKNAHRLVGCDIEKKCGELVYDDERIHIIVGDANSSIAFDSIKKISSTFDIIIDDGSHRSSDIIKSFMRYFPLLVEGGSYIAEDLHCSYWQEYEGGLFDPYSSLSFFRQLVDVINYEHWGVNAEFEETISAVLSHYNIEPASDFPWQSLHSIEFVNSICVIKKLSPIKNQLGMRKITGQLALVNNAIWAMNDSGSRALEQDHNPRSMSENPLIEYEKTVQKMKAAQEREKSTHRNLEKSKVNIENKNQKIHQQQQQLEKKDAELNELRQHSYHLQAMLDSIINSESWKVTAPARLIGRRVKELSLTRLLMQALHQGGGVKGTSRKVLHIYRSEGVGGLRRGFINLKSKSIHQNKTDVLDSECNNYSKWIDKYDSFTEEDELQAREDMEQWEYYPLISVVMPTYNPNPDWLEEAISSVQNQVYPNWELCIADDCSPDKNVRAVLEKYSENKNIKIVFREQNGHISAASNSAISVAEGEWIALLDHDDYLPRNALYHVAKVIVENESVRMIYSDEDKINEEGKRHGPYFKTDWNQDLFYSHNMFSHFGVYYKPLVDEIGGFRVGMEGSQDYDLALRCMELIDPSQIYHIPRVLYHWRIHAGSTAGGADAKPYAMLAGEKALNEHFVRRGVKANVKLVGHGYRVRYELPELNPLVSIIIPTRNSCKLVKQCIQSIVARTTYPNYEILVIDNGSDEEESLRYFDEISNEERVRVCRDDSEFNYSYLNNFGVEKANGSVLALVNNDIEVIEPEWLTEMVSMALQPEMGAIGAKLLYPDNTIQHAGVVLGMQGLANHAHRYFHRDAPGYYSRAQLISSFSAVTAACMVVERSKFEEVGGLDEENLKVAFNDIDFCLKLKAKGYRNVLNPYALLYHHESASRGYDMSAEKKERLQKETDFMTKKWGESIRIDSMYSPNLTLDDSNFNLAWPPRI
nr:glycosyltransferase [uncultured Halomonas sp.]